MDEKDQLIQILIEKISVLEKLVEQQAAVIATQSARIAELENRLNKNSSNSSKPPSSDGLLKPPRTNSLRENGKNKSGGQPGHKGDTLKQIQTPDQIERHRLSQCPTCLAPLTSVEPLGVLKRQVFDIQKPKIEVTEHQAEIKICLCCNKRVIAIFAYGVNASVQYGEVIQSFSIYFQHQQFIPEDRLQETFRDLFNQLVASLMIA
jgi:transposase